jgi:hypothetical protein
MEKAMCEEYRQLNCAYMKKIESDSEVLLFTGVCYNCGKSGHRANDCKKKNDGQGTKKAKFLGKCNNFGLRGHTGKYCWEKEENKNKRPAGWKKKSERGLTINNTTEIRIEYGWTSQDKFQVEDQSIWIADTGATVHSTPHLELLSDNRSPEEDITVVMGNGNKEKVTTIGTVKGNSINKNGKIQGSIDLSGVMYLKNGRYNLLSVTKIMNSGWKLEGDEKSMSLVKENKKLTFDIKIHTTRGVLFAVKIDKRTEIVGIVKEVKKVNLVTSMEAHQCLGHLSQQSTKDTAKQLGWHLTGEFVKCEDCAIGKGHQKNVNKRSDHEIAGMVGERIFLDVASVQEQQKSDNYMEPTQNNTGKSWWMKSHNLR